MLSSVAYIYYMQRYPMSYCFRFKCALVVSRPGYVLAGRFHMSITRATVEAEWRAADQPRNIVPAC